jgi:hypothetical protein
MDHHPYSGYSNGLQVDNPAANVAANVDDGNSTSTSAVDERDMLIARAVMAYLKTKDPAVFEKTRAVFAKTKTNDCEVEVEACLRKPIQQREMVQLKAVVGQVYWQRAEKHLESHFQIAKETSKQCQANLQLQLHLQKLPSSDPQPLQVQLQLQEAPRPCESETYPAFAQTLLNYLETQNRALSREAKEIINDCVAAHQPSHAYDSLIATLKERLKPVVGDFYWKQAETLYAQDSKQPLPLKESPLPVPILAISNKQQVPVASPTLSGQKRKASISLYYVPSPLTTNIHGHADTSSEFWLGLSQNLPRAVTNPNEGPSEDGSTTSTNDPFEPTPVDQLRDMPREEWDQDSPGTSLDGFGF